ncbi:RPL36 [Ecytonucleospora hepatopenaei]|uniref:RPL36 n=1 Tax=Ecytonucleospora hepatopenaei TaxID=646526 RepID=A0A1W0E4T5_9MICR|nr:RPL36 [Ecytonucleospora hepatopenaei]
MKKFFKKIRVHHKVTPIKVEKVIKEKTFELSPAQIVAKKVTSEICGLQPYEKKAVEYIKSDNIKKARKFLKIKLGSLSRGEKKLETLIKLAR